MKDYRRLTHSALWLNLLLLGTLLATILVGVGLVLVSRDSSRRPSFVGRQESIPVRSKGRIEVHLI